MKAADAALEIRSKWNFFWWVAGTIFMPFTIPLIFLHIWDHFKAKHFRSKLHGKVVLITGANSGLGEALSHVFYKAGCKIILAARRESELQRVRKELMELHLTVPTFPPIVVALDLSQLNDIPNKVHNVLSIFGQIDILINNGGIGIRSDVCSTSLDVDLKVMLVNYFGSVAMTKAILPSMIKRQEGKVVFISSVQGKFSIPFRSAYAASKHAIQAFCDALRAEISEFNIKVTCISPGYINTNLSKNALTGCGATHGKLDETTASGINPNIMAKKIFNAVLCEKNDVIIAQKSAHIAYWLRFCCPSLYFWIMEKRTKTAKCKQN